MQKLIKVFLFSLYLILNIGINNNDKKIKYIKGDRNLKEITVDFYNKNKILSVFLISGSIILVIAATRYYYENYNKKKLKKLSVRGFL